MINIKVILEDGDYFYTYVACNYKQARSYYMHKRLNIGSGEKDNIKKVVDVKLVS